MEDAVGHLIDLQARGLIEHLGITNFDHTRMVQIASMVDLVAAQIQFSLLDRRPLEGFTRLAAERDVAIICYGVLAGGFLTDAWLGKSDPGFAFENRSLVKYRLIIEEFGGWTPFQKLLGTLRRIADGHGVDIAAVAMRAMMEESAATAVIIGARSASNLDRTMGATRFSLTDADHSAIAASIKDAPGPRGSVFDLERDRTGTHGRIMKYNLNDPA